MSYGLYIHIPFCIKKCNYCDFISFPYDEYFANLYLGALGMEIDMYRKRFKDKAVRTIYIGGGTPTCLTTGQIYRMLDLLLDKFSPDKDIEFTVEANPGAINKEKLRVMQEAGVNRLSIGAQSFYDKHLRKMGRVHNALDTVLAVEMARKAGFANLNLDLIFGLPRQTLQEWQNTLQEILRLEPEHISAYGLKIEKGTPFALERDVGLLKECSEELEADMYRAAIETLTAAGFHQYEISNFARPGKESHHNLIYWHNEEYQGLGVAAHSFIQGIRWANISPLPEYIKLVNKGTLPIAEEEKVPLARLAEDAIFLGLRLNAGINIADFKKRYNIDLQEKYREIIQKHINNGLLTVEEGHLRLTGEGLYISNEVMVDFI